MRWEKAGTRQQRGPSGAFTCDGRRRCRAMRCYAERPAILRGVYRSRQYVRGGRTALVRIRRDDASRWCTATRPNERAQQEQPLRTELRRDGGAAIARRRRGGARRGSGWECGGSPSEPSGGLMIRGPLEVPLGQLFKRRHPSGVYAIRDHAPLQEVRGIATHQVVHKPARGVSMGSRGVRARRRARWREVRARWSAGGLTESCQAASNHGCTAT